MRISDWSSDVCSSDLHGVGHRIGDDEPVVALDRQPFDLAAVDRPVALVGVLVIRIEPAFLDHPQCLDQAPAVGDRSEEHTSELQSLMRISYAVFCLKQQTNSTNTP